MTEKKITTLAGHYNIVVKEHNKDGLKGVNTHITFEPAITQNQGEKIGLLQIVKATKTDEGVIKSHYVHSHQGNQTPQSQNKILTLQGDICWAIDSFGLSPMYSVDYNYQGTDLCGDTPDTDTSGFKYVDAEEWKGKCKLEDTPSATQENYVMAGLPCQTLFQTVAVRIKDNKFVGYGGVISWGFDAVKYGEALKVNILELQCATELALTDELKTCIKAWNDCSLQGKDLQGKQYKPLIKITGSGF